MNTFTMPAKIYNLIKYLVLIVIPAVSTFYATLGTMNNWDNVTNVTVTLAAVATLLGTMVGISARNFNNNDENYFGEFHISGTDEGAIIDHQVFNEDPTGETLANKKFVRMKVVQS